MTIAHPSAFLAPEILATLRAFSPNAEQNRQLHHEQLRLIYEQRWFMMFVPKAYGGLGLSLPEVLRVEEALAWADGSTAWVVTLCSGAGWFIGFLHPDISNEVFHNDKVCLAGSGAPSGTAVMTDEGYVVNGEWKYASGSLQATMFTANCVITQDGNTLTDKNGDPLVKSFIFRKGEVELIRNWNSMGMIATASHGFAVRNLLISTNRVFQIDKDHTTLSNAIYRYPFLQLAETTLSVNISGMVQQLMDLCYPIFENKMKSRQASKDLLSLLKSSNDSLAECRSDFYEVVERSWSFCSRGENISDDVLAKVSTESRRLHRVSMELSYLLYPYAGLSAADVSTEINRVWRNLNTAGQHTLFTMR